jgi:hypothetical protein
VVAEFFTMDFICAMAELTKDDALYLKAFGNEIRKIRIESEYTSQDGFADDFDFWRSHYNRIEAGKENMKIISIRRLLTHHDITLPAFIERVEKEYQRLLKGNSKVIL